MSRIRVVNPNRALGHEDEFTISGTAASLVPSAAAFSFLNQVVIQVFDDDLVFTDDGSTPSGSHGLIVSKGDILVYEGQQENIKMLRGVALTTTTRLRVA